MIPSQSLQKQGLLDLTLLDVRVRRTEQLGPGVRHRLSALSGAQWGASREDLTVKKPSIWEVSKSPPHRATQSLRAIVGWDEKTHFPEAAPLPAPTKDPMPFTTFVGFLAALFKLQTLRLQSGS